MTAQMLIGAFIIVASVVLITANERDHSDDSGEPEFETHRSQTPSYSTSS